MSNLGIASGGIISCWAVILSDVSLTDVSSISCKTLRVSGGSPDIQSSLHKGLPTGPIAIELHNSAGIEAQLVG